MSSSTATNSVISHSENIRQYLEGLKHCSPVEISHYFSPAFRIYQYLSLAEKTEASRNFYEWAKENAASEPLKFCYAEFFKAVNHHLADEHQEALELLIKTRKHFEEYHDQDGIGLCAAVTGSIYRTLGNFDLALKTSWEGYGFLKESDHYPTTLSACLNSMANINLELQNYEEALTLFQNTLEETLKTGDYYFKIYALHGLGKVNMHLDNYEEAQAYFEDALKLAEENKSVLATANSLAELANFHFRLGNLEATEELHLKAMALRDKHHFTGASVTSCIHLGELYIKRHQWEDALTILNKGLALAEQIKVKPKIYRVHQLLSEIFTGLHEPVKSLYHYKIFHEVREEVEREDNARKLADAKLIFEAEQTRKENIVIRKQKEEIQDKNKELQETIDELTITKVSRKARTFTLVFAIVMFILQDAILSFALNNLPTKSYFISLGIKMGIIFSLSPVNRGIEKYLLKKVVVKKKTMQVVAN